MDPYVHCSVIYNSQDLEVAQVPFRRWVGKKFWDTHTVEYYAAVKTKELFPFATAWMDREIIMLSETRQSEKDKCHMI